MKRASRVELAYVRRRLRPLRFTFLVAPKDTVQFLRAVEANTTLWGGRFNHIVPFSGEEDEVAQGYISAFDPDIVVYQGQAPNNIPVTKHQLISIADLLDPDDSGPPGMQTPPPGLSAVELYDDVYRNELRYLGDKTPQLVVPSAEGVMAPFVSACFGKFPDGKLSFVGHRFDRIGAVPRLVTAENFADTLFDSLTPLRLGATGLRVRRGPPIWFLPIDPENVEDLTWLWNLRACGLRVFPIPRNWEGALLKEVKQMISYHEPQPGVLQRTTCAKLVGRREEFSDLERLAKLVEAPANTLMLHPWLPRLWDRSMWSADGVRRFVPSAADDETEATLHDDGAVRFRSLDPKFVDSKFGARPRWANDISFRMHGRWDLAEVFPNDLPKAELLLTKDYHDLHSRIGRDGHVALCHSANELHHWHVPTGAQVVVDWLKGRGTAPEPSDAGRVADELIRVLDGPRGVSKVSYRSLLELFEKTQRKETRCVRYWTLLSALKILHSNRSDVAERHLQSLISAGILEVGLELGCDACKHHTWYSLDDLQETVRCACCLRVNDFPCHKPPSKNWAYRVKGPFALSGHAKGAYVVASALAFLADFGLSARTSWTTSLEMTRGGSKLESDFTLLWNDDEDEPPITVFGECKTFNSFNPEDIQRMADLGHQFPQAVIAFCTFREKLTDEEVSGIRALAESGRKDWNTPVLVLTMRELTSHSGVPHCWRDGSETAQRIAGTGRLLSNMTALCDATQQIYLGLPPSEGWPTHR